MQQRPSPPRRFAIGVHPELTTADTVAKQIKHTLVEQGATEVFLAPLNNQELRQRVSDGKFDALIAVGGDGTMLRAGHLCAPQGTPIMGINVGHFGFLIEVQHNQWQSKLSDLLEGRYRVENRMMLRAEHWHQNQKMGCWDVLNEVIACRGNFVRPVRLRAEVDGFLLANYVADGLIIATPTGSTAYALAAGGPIMPPDLRNILIIPVAPHLSIDRAVILPEGAQVSVRVRTNHEAVMSIDGHQPIIMQDGDEIRAATGPNVVSFIRFEDPGYFYCNLTKYMEKNPVTGDLDGKS